MLMETKQIESIIDFKEPLSCHEVIKLLEKAIKECNSIFGRDWQKMPFIKRIFTSPDVYHLYYDTHEYCSYDGKSPMKLCGGPYLLNKEEFPDAKYEIRYLISIFGDKDIHLYFNVIPGAAEEDQFGTMISEKELVSRITIKANLKSNPYWKRRQARFLETLVTIIERIN